FVGNYYLAGPGGDDNSGTSIVSKAGGTSIFNGSSSSVTKVFQTGNVKDTNKNGVAEFTGSGTAALTSSDFTNSSIQASAFTQTPYYGVTDTATNAYGRVLNYAGADWWNRSAIDSRIFGQVASGTGKITAFDDPNNGYNSAGVYATGTSDTEWNKL